MPIALRKRTSNAPQTPNPKSPDDEIKRIFNESQRVQTADAALNKLKRLYRSHKYKDLKAPFLSCFKKLLQSEHSIYFKTSCDFVCKFLQSASKLSEEERKKENLEPGTEEEQCESDDELLEEFSLMKPVDKSTLITDHDKLVSSCIDAADLYMQVSDENCRLNAVYFVGKFLSLVDSLDETICDALKGTLPKRFRDRKPMIRAQAVLASRTFQDDKMIRDAFLYHFQRDPELVVRKALLQVMDTKVFGYEYLIQSTQESNESMRKIAFQKLGKLYPKDLSTSQLHDVIHNGLNERERQAAYSFRTHTLEPWLSSLYDGLDLYKLLEPFDPINYHEDVSRLLEIVYERDLENIQNNGATTKLHHVVESFRDQWLSADGTCLPKMSDIDEKLITIWLTMAKYCRSNQSIIKPIKIKPLAPPDTNLEESIEKILDPELNKDEVAELHERLTPDLVNLVHFLRRIVAHFDDVLKKESMQADKVEYIYQQMMMFATTYEIGDELERATVQEVLGTLLKENLLTGKIENYIPLIIRCLFKLIYHSSSNLMINYISELINNVRSHLEDLASSPKTKRVKISHERPKSCQQDLEFKIATIRVDLEDLQDQYEKCIKDKDFDGAKRHNDQINKLKQEYAILHDRRCSVTSDVSHMSMVIETEPIETNKLHSTMICDTSMSETQTNDEDPKLFRNHTNELIKCLQMYLGCLQYVRVTEVPQTMLNHLTHLTHESLDDWFINDFRVRSLMVSCNGVTALVDRNFASRQTTKALLMAACNDPTSIEIRTVGFKSLVDIICMHDDIGVPMDQVENLLNENLRQYGKYDPEQMKKSENEFLTTIIQGTSKLYSRGKLLSPVTFSHLILWWYHPRTPSMLKQYIGVFLPMFVNDLAKEVGDKDFFGDVFVTSIKYLYQYILGPGFEIMAATDMQSLINFLCNLIPTKSHKNILDRVDFEMDTTDSADLKRYLKQSKSILTPVYDD